MKMFGNTSGTLLLFAFCLVCHSSGVMAQQTAGQRFEKALYLEEVNRKLQQAMAKEPKKSTVITLDDKTILDTTTGIRYTKINTWAGKNDVINSAASITDISPNRKFLLADNRVIPFENGDVFHLTDTTRSVWTTSSRLSPDASEIAFFKYKELSVIPVSPETGHPTGSVKKLIEKSTDYHSIYSTLNWSPDGKNLVFTFFEGNYQANLWTWSMIDGSVNQVTYLNGPIFNPVFSKNGLNIFYKYQTNGEGNYSMMMSPSEKGEPVTILDSCWYKDRFILSPDNRWIVYDKTSDSHQYLLRLVDRQKWVLPSPEEVGEFVSWADEGGKVFFTGHPMKLKI